MESGSYITFGVEITNCSELMMAIINLKSAKEIEEIILKNPEKINHQNSQWETALIIAVRKTGTYEDGNKVVKLLLENGANVNLRNKQGWTALISAVYRSGNGGTEETVELLLKHGVNIDSTDRGGSTALMYASRYTGLGYLLAKSTEKTVKILLENGANVNLQNNGGWTALMLAVKYLDKGSTLATAELLLKYGADISIGNISGGNALDIAIGEKNILAIELMLQYMTGLEKVHENDWRAYEKIDIGIFKKIIEYAAKWDCQREIDELKKKNEELEERYQKLKMENEDLQYLPENPGYSKLKKHFGELSEKMEEKK